MTEKAVWGMSYDEFLRADARIIFDVLKSSSPQALASLPRLYGIYALHDHCGHIRYIGVTREPTEGFRGRIANRHVTGSEGRAHKFSHAYNSGRMWRARKGHPRQTAADAKLAKDLRTLFIRRYCKATIVPIEDRAGDSQSFFGQLTALENRVQAIAPSSMREWESLHFSSVEEPTELVDALLDELCWPEERRAALARQSALFASL